MDNSEKIDNLNNEITIINNNLDNQVDYINILQDKLTILQNNIGLLLENYLIHGDISSNIGILNDTINN